ncbi:hypothetical protein D3C72_1424100 [compost metagenome]
MANFSPDSHGCVARVALGSARKSPARTIAALMRASSRSAGAVRMMPQISSEYSGAIREVLQSIHFSACARSIASSAYSVPSE